MINQPKVAGLKWLAMVQHDHLRLVTDAQQWLIEVNDDQ